MFDFNADMWYDLYTDSNDLEIVSTLCVPWVSSIYEHDLVKIGLITATSSILDSKCHCMALALYCCRLLVSRVKRVDA